MPCRSDYMDPTFREREYKRAAKLLVYISDACGIALNSVSYRRQAKDPYGANNVVPAGSAVTELCNVMKHLRPDEFEKFVYDGRNADARDLAAWWEEHTAADRQREAQEAEEARIDKIIESVRAKLTEEEWEVISSYNTPFA